jgi:hypothetical protein
MVGECYLHIETGEQAAMATAVLDSDQRVLGPLDDKRESDRCQ